jgi:hypothetical protein
VTKGPVEEYWEDNIIKGHNLANYSKENKRVTADFYPTPHEVTRALLQKLKLDQSIKIWEPACGEGHMAEEIKLFGHSVESTDLFDRGYGEYGVDFTKQINNRGCQWMITNPPFSEAESFIKTAASMSLDGFALLVKSQYWHAKKRIPLFKKYRPSMILSLTWRPDFMFGERGGAPTMECLWTVWTKGSTRTEYDLLEKPLKTKQEVSFI